MSRPRITKLDKSALDGLTTQDFFPGRLDKEDNTTERITIIANETQKLFKHPKETLPKREEYPTLYHELPTLWALIEEGRFRYWNEKEQTMLKKMIELQLNVTNRQMTDADAEKQAGLVLADRFLAPVSGKISGDSGSGSGSGFGAANDNSKMKPPLPDSHDKGDGSQNIRG